MAHFSEVYIVPLLHSFLLFYSCSISLFGTCASKLVLDFERWKFKLK